MTQVTASAQGAFTREMDDRIQTFEPVDREGRRLTVRFCDAYVFVGEKITLRESYFNSPAV